MTVLEVIQKSADFLAKKGVDSPRLQIELLLAHALKIPRLNLYLNFERSLSNAEADVVRQMVKRRGSREPLQHIVGSTSFCGLEMRVTRAVLVPRPETELLAERAWLYLNGRKTGEWGCIRPKPDCFRERGGDRLSPQSLTRFGGDKLSPPRSSELDAALSGEPGPVSLLDFGTGSGCLAIAIAVKVPTARVCALDISAAAIEVASQNAAAHSVSDKIGFVQGDGFAALPAGSLFDLIVSNPPYIPAGEIETLQPEVRDHDPRLALDGGEDGLDHYRRFAAQAGPFLRSDGRLMVEIGDGQETAIRALFGHHGWSIEAVQSDYTGRPRILEAKTDDSTR